MMTRAETLRRLERLERRLAELARPEEPLDLDRLTDRQRAALVELVQDDVADDQRIVAEALAELDGDLQT
jgi:hypothetical protein